MPNIAILIGNTEYRSLAKLDCCKADVAAMKELRAVECATITYDQLKAGLTQTAPSAPAAFPPKLRSLL